MADPAAHRRQRVALANQLVGLAVLPHGDQGDVALDVDVGRAGVPAGRGAGLVDREEVRDRLGITPVDGLAPAQPLVVLTRHVDRALLGTVPAAVAQQLVDEARLLLEAQGEGPGLPVEGRQMGRGQELDVRVPAGVDQLRAHDAHGAVVGREGLVELGHGAADARLGVDQVDLEAHLGQIQRGLHARDAGAEHGHCAVGRGLGGPRGRRSGGGRALGVGRGFRSPASPGGLEGPILPAHTRLSIMEYTCSILKFL